MQNQPVVCIDKVIGGYALEQFQLNFQWRFAWCQAGAVAHAKDVRVHRHRGLAKGRVQNHICCLAAHTGQRLKCLTRARHLPAMQLDQHPAGLKQVLGLAVEKPNCFDVTLNAIQPQIKHRLRRIRNYKQLACGLVHAHVGRLR